MSRFKIFNILLNFVESNSIECEQQTQKPILFGSYFILESHKKMFRAEKKAVGILKQITCDCGMYVFQTQNKNGINT